MHQSYNFPPDPAGGAFSAVSNPLDGGEGLLVPSARTYHPLSGPEHSAYPDFIPWRRLCFGA